MKCLTSEKALSGQCGFMAANMYARSIFGEDALANLSIEKSTNNPDSTVTGHIRIRAKSQVCTLIFVSVTRYFIFPRLTFHRYCFQGMALSLGDKINMTQKQQPKVSS